MLRQNMCCYVVRNDSTTWFHLKKITETHFIQNCQQMENHRHSENLEYIGFDPKQL